MSTSNQQPPKWAQRLIKAVVRQEFAEDVLGDLEESFHEVLQEKGKRQAYANYWFQTANYLRPFALKVIKVNNSKRTPMFKHFIKISWRQLLRRKVFSAIEIGGLAVGMAACILISLFILHQVSYDKHYAHGERIFRLINYWSDPVESGYWSNVHGPLKEVLEDNLPEIEQVARIVLWTWGDAGENHVRPVESDFNYFHQGFIYADPEFLDILEVPMIYGTTDNALTKPNTMVISRKIWETYFPGENPVGKQMILNDNQKSVYTIGGVMEDFPNTHHLQADFILTLFERNSGPGTSGWCCTNYNMYVRLKEGADKHQVEEKSKDIRDTYVIDGQRKTGATHLDLEIAHQFYYLQPIGDIYLNPEEVNDDLSHGSIDLVWIFGAIAVVVLLLASVNFINLATARSMKRAKEVGILKTIGSFQRDLIVQYLVESVVYCFLAVVVGLLLAWWALPLFNMIGNTQLEIPWLSYWFIPSLVGGAFLIGILSGLYPALYLSRFHPVKVLKGEVSKGRGIQWIRSILVIFQFAATVILISVASATHKQFQFLMEKTLGFDKEQVILLKGLETMEPSGRVTLKNHLKQHPAISNATISDYYPVEGSAVQNRTYWPTDKRQEEVGVEAARWEVDSDYLSTMRIELSSGRNFRENEPNQRNVLINEQMAEILGLEDPIGTNLTDMFDQRHIVIGVVKDFYFESLLGEIRPLVMVYGTGVSTLSLKTQTGDISNTMREIEEVWSGFNGNQSIRYEFMDQQFARMYDQLNRARSIFIIFAILSIVVASLGLFALSIFMVEQRSKEISVRKVMGASVGRIFSMLTFDFIKLVLIAIVIALPVSRQMAEYLFEDMNNQVPLNWWIFISAGLLALFIAMCTISIETFKASSINPARKLRTE